MIHEIADLRTDPAQRESFEQAIRRGAATQLSQAEGYLGHSVIRCIETPGRYLLQVRWASLEAHTVGFRESERFTAWRAIVGPYFVSPPQVEHFEDI